MYHFITAIPQHTELVKNYTEQWKAQSQTAFVNIIPIMKNEATYSGIIDQRGNNIALETKNTTIYYFISGELPSEVQIIADTLQGYKKFDNESDAKSFIEKIIKGE